MRSSSTLNQPDPVRRHASLGRFAAVALAAGLLAACQGPVLDSGDRFTRTASADGATTAAPGGGDRSGRTVSADRAKRAISGGRGNPR
ncbi:MAG: hypothetical protein F4027_12220 [Rhodospirillaceae bacterium]|nr:hypothetical protein [Rhodospirillaceae bacterium]